MAKFKGLIKCCEVCGSEFKVPQSHAHVRTCSAACGYKIRHVANRKDKVELKCANCGNSFLAYPAHAHRRKFCSEACREASPELKAKKSERFSGPGNPGWDGGKGIKTISASGRPYSRQQPHLENERSTRRKRAKERATPAWANLDKVREIYQLCREISEKTGVQHHVDHIVPLTSKMVCGMHNEFNLQILPGVENLRKNNRVWPNMW